MKPTTFFWEQQLLILESTGDNVFFTQINEILDDRIIVEQPLDRFNNRYSAEFNEELSIYFYNDDKSMFAFRSYLHAAGGGRFSLAMPDDDMIQKIQRREFFRVPASIIVCLEDVKGVIRCHYSFDLSGGGVSLLTADTEDYKLDEKVSGCLYLEFAGEPTREIPFHAKIVGGRSKSDKVNLTALAFTQLEESKRSQVIRYCLQLQRDIRDKLGIV